MSSFRSAIIATARHPEFLGGTAVKNNISVSLSPNDWIVILTPFQSIPISGIPSRSIVILKTRMSQSRLLTPTLPAINENELSVVAAIKINLNSMEWPTDLSVRRWFASLTMTALKGHSGVPPRATYSASSGVGVSE